MARLGHLHDVHREARQPQSAPGELRRQDLLRLRQPLLGEHHGFRLVDRVLDEPLFVETGHHVPVHALPGPGAIVEGQVEQGQRCFVDAFGVKFHTVLSEEVVS